MNGCFDFVYLLQQMDCVINTQYRKELCNLCMMY